MKKTINGYIITYIINIILTVICITLLIYYYHSMSIGWEYTGLFGGFQFDLAQIWLIIFLLILLFASLIALIIYLLITIKQSRKQQLEKSAKLGVIIVPIAFFMLLHIVAGISVAITPSEPFDNEWLCSDSDFEEWINDKPEKYPLEYYYQENRFGRVIDLKYYASTRINDNSRLIIKEFNCYFRKSEYPQIFSKFKKIQPRFYNESYESIRDGIQYTVYTSINEYDFIYHYVVIENDSSYLLAEYKSSKSDIISDYSLDEFVDDVFVNYNSWNNE